MKKKRLGVIGGLGPLATAYFFELVIQMTDAETDQEHVEMMIYNRPSVSDRTRFILGKSGENPLPDMIEMGQWLTEQGADIIAIPCITAHYFHKELTEAIAAPIIHVVKETAEHLAAYGIKKAGIMATDGTVCSGLFQQELEKKQIECVLPDEKHQAFVMSLIYEDVKAGRPIEPDKFEAVSDYLRRQGAEVMILGCTELSMIKRDYDIGAGYLDAMEILARKAVLLSGAALKGEYQCLITGYQEKNGKEEENVS
ncbi:MAG: aspartate/glutamate racemase family protein [Lachnospiraceae bacterium]|nr:aspartate/glutamate racemase family protein [Lachnospiraceae bacterium]